MLDMERVMMDGGRNWLLYGRILLQRARSLVWLSICTDSREPLSDALYYETSRYHGPTTSFENRLETLAWARMVR